MPNLQVWLLLFLSIASVTLILQQIQKLLLLQPLLESLPNQNNQYSLRIKLTNPYMYVFGNVLSQG